ncbi:MAG TPA: hypothetical protein PK020_21705 [Ilumatobacteraceae bacterium]|nr:hypothetical protein [Alloalcanivorax xenomutans]MCE7525966.1 hypothetical protein [Alloalcanivorax xenomutans]HQZ37055.1 hypothetical protein [Ilumatobacteraceae bacterium]
MMTPTPAHSADPAATIEIADRDRDWQATTDEAVARIDNAVMTISARAGTADEAATRRHITEQLTAALTVLEQLAERLAAPATGDDEHPF